MYLKKIELIGFKSFAAKTSLEFDVPSFAKATAGKPGKKGVGAETGVTAIVGPNGSGKSNVADAIRWVMGEQSVKALRGKKSHDVIFAGTKGKSRLSSAQVTLFFDNTNKRSNLPFGEVTVKRKVYRDGEGEYRLNGAKVRLMDVIDALAEAGIGKESHCVLNQGMSDATLNANPFERRSIIEEAAGVKPHQIKRERALKKMETTRANLEQSQALVAEIEPRLRILKRQVSRARERHTVETELRETFERYYGHQWYEIQEEKQSAVQATETLGREVKQFERKIDTLYEKRRKMSQSMNVDRSRSELEEKLTQNRKHLSELDRELAVSETKLEIEKERQKTQKFTEHIPVDLHFVREEVRALENIQQALIDAVDAATDISALEDVKQKSREVFSKLKKLYEDCGKKTVEITRAKDIVQKEKQGFETRIRALENAVNILHKKRSTYSEQVKDVEMKIQNRSKDIREQSATLMKLEQTLREAQRHMDSLKDHWNEAKVVAARVEVREEDLEGLIRTALKVSPAQIKKPSGHVNKEEEQLRIEKLERKLATIGGIDPLVEDEYQEAQERYDFLSREIGDLEQAAEALLGIAQEMDRRIAKEFTKAFTVINKEFNRYFKLIFDGGSAELTQVKSEKSKVESEENGELHLRSDPEKSRRDLGVTATAGDVGIEISVSPPRKKIHTLSMLSGGERSLVSLTLLFAIISYNPPPFAVLDEVEAALDESNSRRFSLLLKDLAKKTQFIIITHNRETMTVADTLYGVTMDGDGVSKLLSVKLG